MFVSVFGAVRCCFKELEGWSLLPDRAWGARYKPGPIKSASVGIVVGQCMFVWVVMGEWWFEIVSTKSQFLPVSSSISQRHTSNPLDILLTYRLVIDARMALMHTGTVGGLHSVYASI